jgi:ankyrin repeat protein
MSVNDLKQAIREDHDVTRHDEFLEIVMAKCDRELLDLYLQSGRSVPELVDCGLVDCGIELAHPKASAMTRRLIEWGLDPNRPDWLGRTFLHHCAEKAAQSVAAVLLDAKAEINVRDVEYRGTPLAIAVRAWCQEMDPKQAQRRKQMVEFLLNRGAATNLPGDEPWATPLAWATRSKRADNVELLKQRGAK